jgi:hypothetical protein
MMRDLVAAGGIAALELLAGLRALAGERVEGTFARSGGRPQLPRWHLPRYPWRASVTA